MTAISDNRALWLARHICPHEPALRRWLLGRVRDGHQIDDIVQETYAKLATVTSVEHIENPRAYFFRVALNVIATEIRKAPVVSLDSLSEMERLGIEAPDERIDSMAEMRQELRLVAEAVAQLPEKCREVFILRKVHGLSQREIARHLGVSENTVEKHVGRGIRHLKIFFGRGGKSDRPASKDQIPEAGIYDQSRNEFGD
ncbi:RNA polymerase sigma factor [Rhizorhabdus sp. FW153]|uniref:RNA polymerase sigma factor n=1 Tax=Rhizorhabdus sp. FW153 TaxID=3400216 RepID=UPI003CF96D83